MKNIIPVLILSFFGLLMLNTSCTQEDIPVIVENVDTTDSGPGFGNPDNDTSGSDTSGGGNNEVVGDLRVTVKRESEAGPLLSGVTLKLFETEADLQADQNFIAIAETAGPNEEQAEGTFTFKDLELGEEFWVFALHVENNDTFTASGSKDIIVNNQGGDVNPLSMFVVN